MRRDREKSEFKETVIEIKRVSKKTKGGNTIRFTALVVVGDEKGKVGVGLAKSTDVASAIRKSMEFAKRRMVIIPLSGTTIPYSVEEKFSAAKILLKPAPAGTGLVAGGATRVVLEAAGIHDAVGKIMGTKNKASNVYATLDALKKIAMIDERKKGRLGRKRGIRSMKSIKSIKGREKGSKGSKGSRSSKGQRTSE